MGISVDLPDPPEEEGGKPMAGQEQQQPQSRDSQVEDEIPEAPPAPPEAQASASTEGVDDLLDEIDGVLESNAEEFVRAFVQKGGQ
jgi:prokaryotic ubiquitin-like protein Pup